MTASLPRASQKWNQLIGNDLVVRPSQQSFCSRRRGRTCCIGKARANRARDVKIRVQSVATQVTGNESGFCPPAVYWGTIMVPKLDIYVDTSNPSYTLWCTGQTQPTNQPTLSTLDIAPLRIRTRGRSISLEANQHEKIDEKTCWHLNCRLEERDYHCYSVSRQLPPRGIGLLCNLRQSRSYTPRTQKLSASKCTHLLVGDHPPITPVARCCQNDVQSDKGGECK
jgi:hypothetical protein